MDKDLHDDTRQLRRHYKRCNCLSFVRHLSETGTSCGSFGSFFHMAGRIIRKRIDCQHALHIVCRCSI
jgi:hypothetical protein